MKLESHVEGILFETHYGLDFYYCTVCGKNYEVATWYWSSKSFIHYAEFDICEVCRCEWGLHDGVSLHELFYYRNRFIKQQDKDTQHEIYKQISDLPYKLQSSF